MVIFLILKKDAVSRVDVVYGDIQGSGQWRPLGEGLLPALSSGQGCFENAILKKHVFFLKISIYLKVHQKCRN